MKETIRATQADPRSIITQALCGAEGSQIAAVGKCDTISKILRDYRARQPIPKHI